MACGGGGAGLATSDSCHATSLITLATLMARLLLQLYLNHCYKGLTCAKLLQRILQAGTFQAGGGGAFKLRAVLSQGLALGLAVSQSRPRHTDKEATKHFTVGRSIFDYGCS